jgi:hypothetical protein
VIALDGYRIKLRGRDDSFVRRLVAHRQAGCADGSVKAAVTDDMIEELFIARMIVTPSRGERRV